MKRTGITFAGLAAFIAAPASIIALVDHNVADILAIAWMAFCIVAMVLARKRILKALFNGDGGPPPPQE